MLCKGNDFKILYHHCIIKGRVKIPLDSASGISYFGSVNDFVQGVINIYRVIYTVDGQLLLTCHISSCM